MGEDALNDLKQKKRKLRLRLRLLRGSSDYWGQAKVIYEEIWGINEEIRNSRGIPKFSSRAWRARKRTHQPTLEYLRSLLSYDQLTGKFRWLVYRNSRHGICPGDVAGTLKGDGKDGRHDGGYIQIVVDQHQYRAHRLAWWFMTGTPPPKGIDVEHKNRDRADNRWENLRLATRSQNNCNAKTRRDNRSGVKGVHPNARAYGKPWFARITMNKRIIHLGFFDTIEEAAEARRLAEIKYHGEFRRQ